MEGFSAGLGQIFDANPTLSEGDEGGLTDGRKSINCEDRSVDDLHVSSLLAFVSINSISVLGPCRRGDMIFRKSLPI
jgi:hypothetical protein